VPYNHPILLKTSMLKIMLSLHLEIVVLVSSIFTGTKAYTPDDTSIIVTKAQFFFDCSKHKLPLLGFFSISHTTY
jgi:hypothetical protein